MVSMWLERNVSSCALRTGPGLLERIGLRVLELFVDVEAFSDDFAFWIGNDATDQRARAD